MGTGAVSSEESVKNMGQILSGNTLPVVFYCKTKISLILTGYYLYQAIFFSMLDIISLSTSSLLLIIAAYLTGQVILYGTVEYSSLGRFFYIDALSIIILDIVLLIAFMVSIYSVGYMEEEIRLGKLAKRRLRIYYILMHSFLFTMILALTVRNMGLMWIAIEATLSLSLFGRLLQR
jgi:formate hydrogenlyase subunit 3/multisubunit Na+/H+ antiporter MnhD subunit